MICKGTDGSSVGDWTAFPFLYQSMHTASTLKSAFEEYAARSQSRQSPQSLYDPIRYILSQPGKRVRPVLLLLAYSLFRDDFQRALPAALALEYFHNFTLVHDDIMDAAVVRRGAKSVHMKFGTNTAILSGDLMMIRSFDILLSACGEENVTSIMGIFSDMATLICEGQQMDMDFEKQEIVAVEDYLRMIEKKTAVLLGVALQIGGMLASAPPTQAETLNDIGTDLGKAFQIQDDILDAYGDESLVGKRRGGDILQKKKSILYALALEASSKSGKAMLAELYHTDAANPEVKIQKVLDVFDKIQVKATADEMGMACFRSAQSELEGLGVAGLNVVALVDFTRSLLAREW
jgi:geranylgeranyl diphosphate synthase type II